MRDRLPRAEPPLGVDDRATARGRDARPSRGPRQKSPAHFDNGLALHSHLGMNGRWHIYVRRQAALRKPWLLLATGRAIAASSAARSCGFSESRGRNDPRSGRSGPTAAARVRRRGRRPSAAPTGPGRVGDALLDQKMIAGIGNAIRNEALFAPAIDPWRKVEDLSDEELELVDARERGRDEDLDREGQGVRARSTARTGAACPSCHGPVSARGQGDDNRTAYWCPRCQT